MIYLNTLQIQDCTIGEIIFEEFKCFTLELPWRLNANNVSCIPAGEYPVEKYNSPSKGPCLLLSGVPKRSWIEIHSGNFTREIQGCILVGNGLQDIDGDTIPDVINSRKTLDKLLKILPDNTRITITRYGIPA